MPSSSSGPQVSDAELQVLKVLWEQGSGTVREVAAALERQRRHGKPWAYTTILTLLTRLRSKGYVAHDRGNVAHVFRAAVSRQALLGQGLAELADRMCDGTSSPLVHALVESRRLSPEDVAQLRRMLDELERKDKP